MGAEGKIKACYESMGADYEDAARRLRSDARIEKFLKKVPEDPNYERLSAAVKSRDMQEAFRAAHTMKGICQNLSLTKLGQSVSCLSDRLRERPEYGDDVEQMFHQVQEDYAVTLQAIRNIPAEDMVM